MREGRKEEEERRGEEKNGGERREEKPIPVMLKMLMVCMCSFPGAAKLSETWWLKHIGNVFSLSFGDQKF